ncbi:substrate-specific activator of APC-dependent proteolysis [Coemansia javaensis]|uniref:Substrate-specific activator of APC-dependent proteolysis n=1 Tax=Coemansia javaensis TaxID=2761396 RepID=A0A9W8HGU2_9FUNG|nr:substrate-specific activator of APC-dependent proteolysis [Coemansia javaensis]
MWDEEFDRRVRAAAQQRRLSGASSCGSEAGRLRPASAKDGDTKDAQENARGKPPPAAQAAKACDGSGADSGADPGSGRYVGSRAQPRARTQYATTDSDGAESPTLELAADVATCDVVGIVTRSKARRMKEQPQTTAKAARSVAIPRMPSNATSEGSAATAPASQRGSAEADTPVPPPPPPPPPVHAVHYESPENQPRHVRRSPQFNYDRFIPARSPEPVIDLRRYEKSHRAASPVFSRKANPVEYRAQVEEANRTYDALLRSELLNDRSAADDFGSGRRLRPSSPPPPQPQPQQHHQQQQRSTPRRDAYGLAPSSPNQLPSLVPWSGRAGGVPSSSSSQPPTTPPGSPPVFAYRSPRKTSLNTPTGLLGLGPANARNLFGRASPVHDVYQQSPLAKDSRRILSPRPAPRRIPRDPVKVLDAPGIRDDYYLNLIDWSSSNRIAVALDHEVYVWDARSGQTNRLCEAGTDGDCVTSVGWAENGRHLAIGLHSGAVQIWDVNHERRVRSFAGHTRRVGVVQWNRSVVCTGSRDKRIYNYDSRMTEGAIVSNYYAHTQEVCGLRWSPDGTQLASGGNDNMLLVWDTRFTPLDSRVASYHPDIAPGARAFRRPLFSLSEHTAAVKALAWSPTQRGLLASGGGTDDRTIRLWDTLAGRQVSSHDTRSQVCNLSWSHDGTELVSTHGYSENHIIVWKYPAMRVAAVLAGHTKRVLYLAHSPDGQTIATAAGDETIRFWEVFPRDPAAAAAPDPAALPSFVPRPTRISGATAAAAAAAAAAAGGAGVMLDDLAHIR